MKANSIFNRINRFENIFLKSDLAHPLLAIVKIPEQDFLQLKFHVELYLNSVLGNLSVLTGKDLVDEFVHRRALIRCITPTGMILPKRDTSIYYNLMLRTYYRVISKLYFFRTLKDCHTPAHLRVKWADSSSDEVFRPRHAPEEMHFDTWSGYSSHGLTFLLSVLGDSSNNRVRFFAPTEVFDDDWLSNSKKPSVDLLETCFKPLEIVPGYGSLVIMDAALLHQTYREPGCGARVSIDNIFRTHEVLSSEEFMEPARQSELTAISDLTCLGAESYYFCYHSDDDRKDSKGGSIDPTECRFVRLES